MNIGCHDACPTPHGACCVGAVCTTEVHEDDCTGTWDAGNTCDISRGPPHSFCCPANFNRDGQKDVADIFAMLAAWFSGAAAADWDGSGATEIGDFFLFLGGWFAAC
jgi:hypothetical protein